MKKMIFTAMAVLAFSAVSMANTIEVKEEILIKKESDINKDEAFPTIDFCAIAAIATYIELSDLGINEEDCANEAAAAYADCQS